jgi:hypothetical protein
MLKTIVDKIGSVIETPFLYGSFLPVLIFVSAVIGTFATVLGYEACLNWAVNRTAAAATFYPMAIAVALIVFAYILSALRPLILGFWTGQVPWSGPLGRILTAIARKRYDERRAQAEAFNEWGGTPDWFADAAMKDWTKGVNDACACELKDMLAEIETLSPEAGVPEVKLRVQTIFLNQLDGKFKGESLSSAYMAIRDKLTAWNRSEAFQANAMRWKLDRDYGPRECIRPTCLGNIIESYNSYSFTRFGIEPEVFWPHLQCQLGDDMKKPMETAHTILDFALAVSSFAMLYSLLCLFVGPWLWSDGIWTWVGLAVVGWIAAYVTYQVAVYAADQYGDLFRASFDLFRFKLLDAFHRPTPKRHSDEKEMWEELSRLVVYGETTNFLLVAPQGMGFGAGILGGKP